MNATHQKKATPATTDQPLVTYEESEQLAQLIELWPRLTRWQKTEINWKLYGMIVKTFFQGPTKKMAIAVVVCFWHLIVPDLVTFGLPILFAVIWLVTLARILGG
jgi:hypothetical protein